LDRDDQVVEGEAILNMLHSVLKCRTKSDEPLCLMEKRASWEELCFTWQRLSFWGSWQHWLLCSSLRWFIRSSMGLHSFSEDSVLLRKHLRH
jgi:hypothetical protein